MILSKFDHGQTTAWSAFILDNLAHGLFTVDSNLHITYFNPMAELITGYKADEALGRSCGEVMRGGRCGGDCPLRTVLNREKNSISAETTILSKDDRVIPIIFRAAAVFDDHGSLIGAVESFSDLSQVKALEAERTQTLSFFAHDMKSPLVTVAGFLTRLLSGKAGEVSGKQRDYLNVIQKEITRIQSLVLDFLDVAQLRRGESIRLATAPTDLEKLLTDLAQVYRDRAWLKDLKFQTDIHSPLPPVEADSHRLGRVFANLLDNAIKFAEQGAVELTAKCTDSGIIKVEVVDRGPGFSPDDLDKLFTPFHRGSAGKGIEGTGLGMAAVKAIVEAHGGAVKAQNRSHGGARVTVSLPVQGNETPKS